MKNTLACAILLLFAVVLPLASLQAQAPPAPVTDHFDPVKNIVKLSPFHFAEGTFLLSYERMLGEQNSSLMLSLGLRSRAPRNPQTGVSSPEFGFQEELQYRFYVIPPHDYSRNSDGFWFFKGFYGAPYASHRFLQRTASVFDWILQQNVDTYENIHELGGGVILGVQFAMGNRFFIDLFTGGGIKRSFGDIREVSFIPATQPGYNGVYPKIGFQIGIGI